MRACNRGFALCCIPLGLLAVMALTASAPPEAQPVVNVTVVKPERKTVRRHLEMPGRVEPSEQAGVYAQVSGLIQKVHVDIGDRVRKGQILAEVAVPELEQEAVQKKAVVVRAEAEVEQARRAIQSAEATLASAKAQVLAAQAGIKRARANLTRWKTEAERLQKVAEQRVIDRQTLDEARHQFEAAGAALEEAEARVKGAEAAREEAEARRDKTQADLKVAGANVEVTRADAERVSILLQHAKVRAPLDGIITRRTVDAGAFIQPPRGGKAEPLFVIMRVDPVRVTADVPEANAHLAGKAAPAAVRVPALPGQAFQGKVTRTAEVLDPRARTLRVEVDLPNPDGKLRPGMYAMVAITAERSGVWALPPTAVVTDGGPPFCFLVENGKAIRTPLQVGLHGDHAVEILKKQARPAKPGEGAAWQDLTGSEEVVLKGAAALKDGQPVRVVPADGAKEDETPKPGAKGKDDLKALLKERLDVARKGYETAVKLTQQTRRSKDVIVPLATAEQVCTWSLRWLEAQRALGGKEGDPVAALEAHLGRLKQLEQMVKALQEVVSPLDRSEVEFRRVQADLWLAQEKAKKGTGP